MSKATSHLTIACFGEILWDCVPRGIFLGGAPLNVAYHLSQLGITPLMISAVGRDFLGGEALRRLGAWDFDLSWIGQNGRSTGTVLAGLNDAGSADYTFAPRPAWDAISVRPALYRRSVAPVAIVFGTLALRMTANRKVLGKLLDSWTGAVRVADLNLRPPFDRFETISWVLKRADLLKMNGDEIACLAGSKHADPAGWEKSARRVAHNYKIRKICVTAGALGAGMLWGDDWTWVDAHQVRVRDTIGAGDAFLAALLTGLLHFGEKPAAALHRACRLGEFVAAQDGATPSYRCDPQGRPFSLQDFRLNAPLAEPDSTRIKKT